MSKVWGATRVISNLQFQYLDWAQLPLYAALFLGKITREATAKPLSQR